MDKYRHLLFNYENRKETMFVYELALERGKGRGWYPMDWKLSDYMDHLFKPKKQDRVISDLIPKQKSFKTQF